MCLCSQICSPALQPVLQDETRGGCIELTRIKASTPSSSLLLYASYDDWRAPSWGVCREEPDWESVLFSAYRVPSTCPYLYSLNRPQTLSVICCHTSVNQEAAPVFCIVAMCEVETCYDAHITEFMVAISVILISIRTLSQFQLIVFVSSFSSNHYEYIVGGMSPPSQPIHGNHLNDRWPKH